MGSCKLEVVCKEDKSSNGQDVVVNQLKYGSNSRRPHYLYLALDFECFFYAKKVVKLF